MINETKDRPRIIEVEGERALVVGYSTFEGEEQLRAVRRSDRTIERIDVKVKKGEYIVIGERTRPIEAWLLYDKMLRGVGL